MLSLRSLGLRCGGLALAGAMVLLLSAANRGPIRQLSLDPEAPVVPLFEGVASGQFALRMSALNPYQANVVIANTSDAPLTVALPKAAVGVHVLPQFNFNGNNGFFQGNQGQFGNAAGNGQGMANAAQSVGGPMQGIGALNNGGPGQNFFGQGFPNVPAEMVNDDLQQYGGLATIPAGQSILLKQRTVCLNYGRKEPMAKMTYQLLPVETYSSDPVLAELLESYSERVDREVMQAAAWHVGSGLPWEQVQQLPDRTIPGVSARLFQRRQVEAAKELVAAAEESAKQRQERGVSSTPEVARADQTP